MNNLDSKDIYLKKNNEIIGLHAIGHNEEYTVKIVELDGSSRLEKLNFIELEKWGNKYDQDLNMIGGSFHVFDLSIEKTAQEFELDGWTRFSPK